MKILFTDATLMHGGAERVISIIANQLVQMGYEVEILLYYDREIWYEIDSRVEIDNDETHIGKANPIRHILWRHKYFKDSDADIVISFLAPFNIINIIAMLGIHKPLIVADRNDPRKTPSNPLVRFARDVLYNWASGVVVQSVNNKNYFSKAIQNKSVVVFNPVDVGNYAKSGLENLTNNKDIVVVGRLIEQKNPMLVLKAFSNIATEFPEYKLSYYGEGDMREILEQKARELGLEDRVALPGAVKNVFDKLKSARLFVMSSQYEGMPNALIEAMCVGVPVISTKVSGAVDLIESEKNGLLVECDSEEQLTMAMRKMLKDESFALFCAEQATELNEKLSCEQIVNEWLTHIKTYL